MTAQERGGDGEKQAVDLAVAFRQVKQAGLAEMVHVRSNNIPSLRGQDANCITNVTSLDVAEFVIVSS